MALFGALLGFAYLTTFPSRAFSSQKEYEASLKKAEEAGDASPAPKPGDAYSIEGAILPTRTWEAKRQQLATPGARTVKFSEGELNAWMSAKFRPGMPAAGNDEPSVLIVPGVPNFAMTEAGTLYLNLPTTITAYGSKNEFAVSARCLADGSGIQIATVQVSSAKVPFPNLLGREILATLSKGFQSTEEYSIISEALARAESVEVVGGELVLELR